MKITRRTAAAVLAAPALLASSGPEDAPKFAPAEGSEVTKTFAQIWELDLDDFSIIADGEDVGGMLGNFELSFRYDQTIEVSDVYDQVGADRPKKLTRTFQALESLMSVSAMSDMGGGDETDMPYSSELEGRTVVFTWDEDDGLYTRSFEGGEGDDELLEDLEEDMDLRVLLPNKPVSVGDTWTVDLADLGSILMPGGSLAILPDDMEAADVESMEMFEEMFGDSAEELAEQFEGEFKCTFKGTTEEEGTKLAEITIEFEVASNMDLADKLFELFEAMSSELGGEAPDFSIDVADLNIDCDGDGVLAWDLTRHRAYSLNIDADVTVAIDVAVTGDMGGESGSVELSAEASGTIEEIVETR